MNDTTATVATGSTMGIVMFLVILAVVGLIIGALARFALPGRDDMSVWRTMAYGVGGAFLGGIISRLLGISNPIVGYLIAIAVAMGLIWFFTRRNKKTP
jgi:uncharacterized membrane protein YeaQ/YmgE (transglycosylase-associated protein family)